MKRILHILFLACLVAACTPPVETRHGASPQTGDMMCQTRHGASLPTDDMHPRLAAIDSLMWQQPDSALAVLLDFAGSPLADSLDAFDRHYFQMLLSELLYKNDCEQSNRTELLRAVDYFDSIVTTDGRDAINRVSTDNIIFLDARAHYINGVGFYERDSIVEACEEYLKTLEVMEGNFEDEGLIGQKAIFITYICNRLGDLFEDQLLAEPAITCYKQALFYCRREPTSIYGIPVLLYRLGIQYNIIGQIDSAAFYYDDALANMPDFDNLHYRDLMVNKTIFAYYNLDYSSDSLINVLKQLVALSADEEEKTTRLLTLGNILFEEKQYDSARVYLETVFEQQEDITSKIMAAENLCNIYQIEGDSVKARQYSLFLAKFTMAEIEKKRDLSKINEMFKNYSAYKQNKHAEEERETAIKRVIGIVIPIAVVVALAIVVVAKRRGRKQMAGKEMEHEKALEFERQTHQMHQAALSGRLKRSNQELCELKEQIKQQDDLAAKTEAAASFTEEPVCRLILERAKEGQFKSKVDCSAYKDYALGKQQMLELRLAVDRHFGNFTIRLKENYPALTKGDLDYCCLYLLGITDADVAALMQKAYSTVSDRSRKLKTIFGKEDLLVHILRQIAEN